MHHCLCQPVGTTSGTMSCIQYSKTIIYSLVDISHHSVECKILQLFVLHLAVYIKIRLLSKLKYYDNIILMLCFCSEVLQTFSNIYSLEVKSLG